MKKSRPIRLFLSLCILAALLLPPAALADGESTAPSTTGTGSALLDSLHIDAAAAILVDADTGEVLYEQDSHTQRYPASITKVMTCLLTVEAIDRGELALTDMVTVSSNLHSGIGEGGSTADIQAGEIISVEDLLYSALLPSANEACNVLAETVAGDIASFVELMNQRAAELGMEDTHFANTHGYHDADHYTSAYDISLMCIEAMKHPTFREIVSSPNHTMAATNIHTQTRIIRSTNALVSNWTVREYYYSEATGIKTGSTPEAGYCLASSATRGDRSLIAVVMGGTDYRENAQTNYFTESRRLLEFGFDNFQVVTILDAAEIDIAGVHHHLLPWKGLRHSGSSGQQRRPPLRVALPPGPASDLFQLPLGPGTPGRPCCRYSVPGAPPRSPGQTAQPLRQRRTAQRVRRQALYWRAAAQIGPALRPYSIYQKIARIQANLLTGMRCPANDKAGALR